MMEKQHPDIDKGLEEITKLFRETRASWRSNENTATSKVSDLRKQVRQLIERSRCISNTLNSPYNLEFKQKAADILVDIGLLADLCDLAVDWLELTSKTGEDKEFKEKVDLMKDILECLGHFTDHAGVTCKAVQRHERLVRALLIRLQELFGEQHADSLQLKDRSVSEFAIVILHNIAYFEENVPFLQNLPRTFDILQNYTTKGSKRTRFAALTAMAEVATDQQVDLLATNVEMVDYILQQLEQAQDIDTGYTKAGNEASELIRAVAILAKNKRNSELLVQKGVLSYLERAFKAAEEQEGCLRCQKSIEALWYLSLVEKNKAEIVANTQLVDSVVKIYEDRMKNHSKLCTDVSEKVLSSLRDHLGKNERFKHVVFQIQHGETNDVYVMTKRPRGHCVIINNRDFGNADTRLGTEVDREKLEKVFDRMKFKVTIQNNSTGEDMIKLIKAVANMNQKKHDLFVCCILSHGTAGRVSGVDNTSVEMRDLMAPVQANECRDLADKPKLFFIQACQGDGSQAVTDEQHNTTATDAIGDAVRYGSIPNEADFLLGYCTVPGNVAYRHPREGSPYISALCEYLDNNYEHLDILDIMTKVTDQVSQKNIVDKNAVTVRQLPTPIYTLRKKLFFGKS